MKVILFIFTTILYSTFANADSNLEPYFSFNGFVLEKTKLADIQKLLGETELYGEGDAAESYSAICYYYKNQNTTVYYESGEMGGRTTLLSYRLFRGVEKKFPCATINDNGKEKFNVSTLKLGMPTKDALVSLPKNPTSIDGMHFHYWSKIPFTKEEIKRMNVTDMSYAFWDQGVSISLEEKDGIICGLRVSKVTSW